MKMLFRTGIISKDSNEIGIDKIHFTTFDTDVLNKFGKSLWQVIGLLSRYDIEMYHKINGKDIFYFYDRNLDKKLILDELDTIILRNNIGNIVNYEDVMIKEAIENIDLNKVMSINNGYEVTINETIYWDVLNHFVIIIGKDELRNFALAMEEEKYQNYLEIFNYEKTENFIPEANMTETIKKMLLLSEDD